MVTMSSLLVLLTISLPLLTLQASVQSENLDTLPGWKKSLVLKALRALDEQSCLDCLDKAVSRTADDDPSIREITRILPAKKKEPKRQRRGNLPGSYNMGYDAFNPATAPPQNKQ